MDAKEPKIRFKGFTDPWEQRKLGELGVVSTGNTPPTSHAEYYSVEGLPWVTPTDIDGSWDIATEKRLSPEGQKIARIVGPGSILCTCIASIGKNAIANSACAFNQQINALEPDLKKYDPYFLFAESELWSRQMKQIAAAATMQIVNKSEFSNLLVRVASLEEQRWLGMFFVKLDNLITLHQRERKLKGR